MGDKMEKELPEVYKNPIDHEVRNNETVHYVGKNEENSEKEKVKTKREILEEELLGDNIYVKINNIFHSPNYIYKANVEITYNDDKVELKKIIGKNRDSIITIDNELIAIKDIKNIKLAHEKKEM